jgi:large subunit ribosomal protein L25
VLARDVQLDPVKDLPIHVDFLRVSATTEVNVDVPVHFVNQEESPGLERGGMLNVVRYTLELVCKADSIPESVEVDLTGLEIGDSVHISQVALPTGVRPAIEDRDFTVASVAAPSAIKEEAAEEQAAEEAEEEEEEFEGEAEAAEAAEGEAAAEESGEGESET